MASRHTVVLSGMLALGLALALALSAFTSTSLGAAAGTPISWSSHATLQTPRALSSLAALDQYAYVIAGLNESGELLSTVERSDISSIAPGWVLDTGLPSARYGQATVAVGGSIYLIGGWNGFVNAQDVYRASRTPTGLTPWTALNPLPEGRSLLAAAGLSRPGGQSYLFVTGGWDGFATTKTVFQGKITPGGIEWSRGPDLRLSLIGHQSVVVSSGGNDYLYVIGGNDGASRVNSIYRARINATGNLEQWEQVASGSLEARDYHTAGVFRDHVVVVGGRDANGNSSNKVFAAPIQPDGSLGAWSTDFVKPLDVPLDRHAMTVVNTKDCGEMLLVAGGRSNGAYQGKTYLSECIAPTPTPTATQTTTPTLIPTPSPTLTPNVPWARWADNRPIYVRPNATASVVLLYGSFNEPRLEAGLNSDQVYFPESNSPDISIPLLTSESSYALQVAALAQATPAVVKLRANVGRVFLEERNVVVISRAVYLPLALNTKPQPSPTPFPTPGANQRQISGKVAHPSGGLGGTPGAPYPMAVLKLFDASGDACQSTSPTPKATAVTNQDGMHYFNVEKNAFCVYSEPPVANLKCDLDAVQTNPRYIPSGSEAVNADFLWNCALPLGH